MKSIKEKSEEFSFMEEGTDLNGMPYKVYNSYIMVGFKKGANYVIEEIEKLIDNQNWCAFPKQSHKELKELIEQLKK